MTVPDIATVPTQFHGLYAKDDASGSFKLRTDDPATKGAVEAISGLARALKAERGVSASLKTKAIDLSDLDEFGKTPAEIKASFTAKLEELQGQVTKGGKTALDALRGDMAKAHGTEKEKLAVRIAGLTTQLYNMTVINVAQVELIAAGAIDPDLSMPFVQKFAKAVEEDGVVKTQITDEQGNPRFGPTGSPMTIKELILEMRAMPKYAPLFKGEQQGGGGAPPGQAGRNAKPPIDATKMTANQKIAAGLSKGLGKRADGAERRAAGAM